jgi:hypothetical protein
MKRRSSWQFLFALLVLWSTASAATWAQMSGGNLEGKVVDEQGSPLPGVTMTVTNSETGAQRVDVTDEGGGFRFSALPAGSYTVLADLSGFGSASQENVAINVASTRRMEITLAASVQETISVIDEAPLLNTEPAQGTIVSQKELESLPLNGRQFANVAVLAPGTSLAYNADPTKPGQLTIALNAGSGRNVNFLIDGGDNTDDTIGGALQNFNLEAVQEFKIQTSQYKAEYGRSSGGVLSVVTKSGGNDFEGSVYEYRRDDSLSERTETEKQAGIDKQELQRDQYGVSLGGPIVHDRARFFATYEKTKRDTSYTVATGGVLPQVDGRSIPTPFTDELYTAKVSVDLTPKQLLQVRYGYQKNADKYGASSLADPSSLGTITNKYDSVLASHTLQLGSNTLNELALQYTRFDNLITADSNDPALVFPGGVTVGQNANTPQFTIQRKRQIRDDLSHSVVLGGKSHDFKFGFGYVDEPTLTANIGSGQAGTFNLLEDRIGSPVTQITINGGDGVVNTPIQQYSGYVQDDWAVSGRLMLNFGVRYDFNDGFDIDQRANPIWQTLSTQTTYNEAYLRDFQGGEGGILENDDDNVSPRFGFTWDTKGDGRTLLRGGFGRFYDFPYTNATILFPVIAARTAFGVVYQYTDNAGIKNPDGSFFQPGQALPPNQLPGADIPPPNEVASPTLATPYSDQISLGYSWQVNSWLGLNFDAITIEYRDIPYRFRANPTLDANGNHQATRRFSDFANFRMWYGDGEASYDGLNVSARVRLDRFELQGFYTLSKAEGNVLSGADEFRLTSGYQSDYAALASNASINSLDPQCDACFGPLNTDARHRLTLGGTYQAPWGVRVSGMFRYRSANPYTKINAAGADLNGDSFRNDLDPSVSHVNSERGESFSQLDVRLAKAFTFGNFGIEVLAEMFNVFNEKNGAVYDRFGATSAYAGDPLQGEQRLVQLGARLTF